MKKYAVLAFALLGISLFAHGFYMQGKAWLAQRLIEQAWEQALVKPRTKVKPWFYADSYVTGQVNWPTREKKLTLLAGATGRNLAFAPSHFLPSAKLGEHNKAVLIAGHNDTHFAFLADVTQGEHFTLQLQNGELQHYQVTKIDIIHQSDSAFLNVPGLYLMTCYPFDSLTSGTDLRLLVSATLVSSSRGGSIITS
ncbi:class GN sortase [Pseudoalteromonas sp. MMG010]|uniref:class GN sortase n=1 Tax=Pseudoalteromonas sp. MMG010 TaxID=2822685 RepID=UPI001B3A17C7|nr:class GN sortase [Pseudoalteromonas sp. MMG010]MBQ4832009.1 class GN sortase [Pseudoalteromonas sp. MMG010]